jgi:hypothetical protein
VQLVDDLRLSTERNLLSQFIAGDLT